MEWNNNSLQSLGLFSCDDDVPSVVTSDWRGAVERKKPSRAGCGTSSKWKRSEAGPYTNQPTLPPSISPTSIHLAFTSPRHGTGRTRTNNRQGHKAVLNNRHHSPLRLFFPPVSPKLKLEHASHPLPHAFSHTSHDTTQNNTCTQPLRLRLTAHRHHVGSPGLLWPSAIGSVHHLPSLQQACRPPAAHQRAHFSRAIRHLAMALQPRNAP